MKPRWKWNEKTVRRILILPLLPVTLLGFAWAQATVRNPTNAETEKEVLEVERQKDQAVRSRDIAVLEGIYADDMAFVNGRGQVVTKAQHLDEIRSGNVKYLSSNKSDYHVHLYGSTAVLTGRENSIVEYHGKTISSPRQFITVYVKLDGQWKYVAHQVTPVAEQ